MIANDKDGEKYLTSVRDGSFKPGRGIGCELDNHLRYKQNNFNIIAGHMNVGKTAWVLWYYFCLAIQHGITFCLYCAENEIGEQKESLIELYCMKALKDQTDLEYTAALLWVNHQFKWIAHEDWFNLHKKMMTYKDVLSAFKDTECDSLTIDPYNSLRVLDGSKGGHEYDYKVASEIRMHCKINNKSVYILAHGNTEALRKQYPKDHDKYPGFPIPLAAADIEGGGKWSNRCDDMIVPHRLTQHPSDYMITQIHVRKVKRTKTGGKPTVLDDPIECKMMQGIWFDVNGVNPITHKSEPRPADLSPNMDFKDELDDLYNDKERD